MIELLSNIGYSAGAIIGFVVLGYIFKDTWITYKDSKIAESQKTLDTIISELDSSLEKFYLPLRERFVVTKHINDLIFQNGESTELEKKIFEEEKPGILRDIAVNKILLPLNSEIKDILLNGLHLRDESDLTNYETILSHYVVWEALETSMREGDISTYNANELLRFPSEQVSICKDICEQLLNKRQRLREELLSLRGIPKSLSRTIINGESEMKKENLDFYKSSFSAAYQPTCVGVAKSDGKVFVTNTNTKSEFVDFTHEEWDAFIQGVKAGEFDKFASK